MDSFSWTDSVHAAVSTCLPCFTSTQRGSSGSGDESEGRAARSRQSHYDELEGLLGDVEDTDVDAETMSLHSNLGRTDGDVQQRKKKKRRRQKKSIRLFGFNLFGRPPIELSESEDDEDGRTALASRRQRIGRILSAHSSSSNSAFDSDASPLDPAAIAQLSAQDAAARATHEAALHAAEEQRRHEERAEKEERRRRRRERRELKRVAQALSTRVVMNMDGEQFEGFPGSGQLRAPFSVGSGSAVSSPTVPNAPIQEFGAYVGGTTPSAASGDELADEEADFGGGAYARKTRSRGSDSSRSHSLSQTSASQSNTGSSQYNHHHLSQGSPLPSPIAFNPPSAVGRAAPMMEVPRRKKKKQSSTSVSQSSGKKSSGSPTSQSASLPSLGSPVYNNFGRRFAPSEPYIVEHETGQSLGDLSRESADFQTDVQDTSKFPSVGFGGIRRTDSSGSGVFLARRGDD